MGITAREQLHEDSREIAAAEALEDSPRQLDKGYRATAKGLLAVQKARHQKRCVKIPLGLCHKRMRLMYL